MNLKLTPSLVIIYITTLLFACSNPEQITESGLKYVHHIKNEGAKAVEEGLYITFHHEILNNADSLIIKMEENRADKRPFKVAVEQGMLHEGLLLCHEGDSIEMIAAAKDLFGQRVPPNVKPEDVLKLRLRIASVDTEEELREKYLAEEEERQKEQDTAILEHLKSNGLEAQKTESGIYYIIEEEGTGAAPTVQSKVSVNYKGYLLDGANFDASQEGKPLDFVLGQGQVIRGWDEGIALFKKGGKGSLYIPSHLAYGGSQMGDVIPPHSILKFEIELVDITTKEEMLAKEDQEIKAYLKKNNIKAKKTESGLYYVMDKKGTGKATNAGQKVSVHYDGYLLDGTKFDSSRDRDKPFSFTLGQRQVIQGWDEGIALFKVGGKGTLYIPSHLAYGAAQQGRIIKPYSILKFDIELLEVND